MASIVIAGDTSGTVTLAAPATAGTTTLTLPTTNGTVLTTGSTTGVNASAISTGTLAVANGGTGTATPSLIGGTNITISGSFPNQTVTAAGGGVTSLNGQTGAITNTDLYAIGSYFFGFINSPQSFVTAGTTYSATSIRASGIMCNDIGDRFTMTAMFGTGTQPTAGTYRYTQTGNSTSDAINRYFFGIFVRIS